MRGRGNDQSIKTNMLHGPMSLTFFTKVPNMNYGLEMYFLQDILVRSP